jgi:hypothetical protein
MPDVDPHLFPTVIREMIRHENDVTNHRLMWLLIGQGLIANAGVSAGSIKSSLVSVLAPVGMLVSLSAFTILYKSYHARGYLAFLGEAAKQGTLPEEKLPLIGWPAKRVKDWRKNVWLCPWLGRAEDLLEPYFFLPALMILAWLFVLVQHWCTLDTGMLLGLSVVLVASMLFLFCYFWVRAQGKYEKEP